jgi:hypothetical protein
MQRDITSTNTPHSSSHLYKRTSWGVSKALPSDTANTQRKQFTFIFKAYQLGINCRSILFEKEKEMNGET